MKQIFQQISFWGLLLLVFSGCDKNDNLDNTNVTAVDNIFSPANDYFVKLKPATSASVVFEWEQAKAEDGGLVLYEIAFDEEGGDFSQPVYKIVSDNGGIYNKATLSHKVLNSIANLGGIPSLGTGKLIWTVFSSKGINEKQASVTRTIELERPAGFADIPADVYITGDATEGGTDINNAIMMKQVDNGEFELYTSLKAGTYQFIDRKTGTPNTFYIDGTELKEDGSTTVTGATKVYRINLDFNNASVSMTEIKEIGLWFAPNDVIYFNLDYIGGGNWKADDKMIEFRQESWGRDERYKFRMTVDKGNGDEYEWMGSSNADNSRPTDNSPASYWYLFPINNNDRWNYSYKFKTEVDNKINDVIVKFSNTSPYTHEVIVQ